MTLSGGAIRGFCTSDKPLHGKPKAEQHARHNLPLRADILPSDSSLFDPDIDHRVHLRLPTECPEHLRRNWMVLCAGFPKVEDLQPTSFRIIRITFDVWIVRSGAMRQPNRVDEVNAVDSPGPAAGAPVRAERLPRNLIRIGGLSSDHQNRLSSNRIPSHSEPKSSA